MTHDTGTQPSPPPPARKPVPRRALVVVPHPRADSLTWTRPHSIIQKHRETGRYDVIHRVGITWMTLEIPEIWSFE